MGSDSISSISPCHPDITLHADDPFGLAEHSHNFEVCAGSSHPEVHVRCIDPSTRIVALPETIQDQVQLRPCVLSKLLILLAHRFAPSLVIEQLNNASCFRDR